MKRRRFVRRGDLRLVAAVLATVAFAVLLNQPSRSANRPTWLDSSVLRLNHPTATTLDSVVINMVPSDSSSAVALPTALPQRRVTAVRAERIASHGFDWQPQNSIADSPIFKNP